MVVTLGREFQQVYFIGAAAAAIREWSGLGPCHEKMHRCSVCSACVDRIDFAGHWRAAGPPIKRSYFFGPVTGDHGVVE